MASKKKIDVVGSFLRPTFLKEARADYESGKISKGVLTEVEDKAIRELVQKQQKSGLPFITDGEFQRATWHLDFMWGCEGVGHNKTENGISFHDEAALIDDTCLVGKLGVGYHPFVEHFKFVQSLEDENTKAKQTIPAPAQFLEQLILPQNIERTLQFYPDIDAVIEDLTTV